MPLRECRCRAVRSARFARIVHVALLVIPFVAATVAALVGGSGDESADPFFGIEAIVVVVRAANDARPAHRDEDGRAARIRLDVFLRRPGLPPGRSASPPRGTLLASYQTPYVASLPGSDVAGPIA